MVKVKKNKLIHLTKTQKKGITLKKELIQKVREWIDQYDNIYVLQTSKNVKTIKIQKMRDDWKNSENRGRFSFGKNKVLSVALGKKPEDEYHKNLHLLSNDIKGDSALLFSSANEDQVRNYIKKINEKEFTISLLALWKKDGSYKTFRNRKQSNENKMED